MYPLLTDDNTADGNLDKSNSLLISVSHTSILRKSPQEIFFVFGLKHKLEKNSEVFGLLFRVFIPTVTFFEFKR